MPLQSETIVLTGPATTEYSSAIQGRLYRFHLQTTAGITTTDVVVTKASDDEVVLSLTGITAEYGESDGEGIFFVRRESVHDINGSSLTGPEMYYLNNEPLILTATPVAGAVTLEVWWLQD